MSCCQDGCNCSGGCDNQGKEQEEVGSQEQERLMTIDIYRYLIDSSGASKYIAHYEDVPVDSVQVNGRMVSFTYNEKLHVFVLADSVQVGMIEQ